MNPHLHVSSFYELAQSIIVLRVCQSAKKSTFAGDIEFGEVQRLLAAYGSVTAGVTTNRYRTTVNLKYCVEQLRISHWVSDIRSL